MNYQDMIVRKSDKVVFAIKTIKHFKRHPSNIDLSINPLGIETPCKAFWHSAAMYSFHPRCYKSHAGISFGYFKEVIKFFSRHLWGGVA